MIDATQDLPKGPTFGARLRTWFLTGVVVAGPLAVTGYLVWWFVTSVDAMVRTIVPARLLPDAFLPVHIPGFGVVIAFVGLTLLGFLAANLAGRTAITVGETLLSRMPIVRSIYRGAKQIFETLFSAQGSSLRRVGLVEFPMKGQWALVFISSPPTSLVESRLPPSEEQRVSVFLPCVPNPTTGFYFYLPARDVIELPMSPEDAAKLIMSCGLIQPEGQAALGAMAAAARRQGELATPARDPASSLG
ncbi:MAG: DUF502 domain-containing protein [Caulobacteraceae bacterium]|nr:DUF502 domain-containing protein [Caulobacter sp.]